MIQAIETDEREDEGPEESPALEGSAAADEGAGEEATGAADEPEPAERIGEAETALRTGPGEALSDEELRRQAAALLFAAAEPIGLARLVQLLERPDRRRLQGLLQDLAQELASAPLPIVLREIQGGWRLFTDPAQAEVVARLHDAPKPERISSAALETLAIVAYRQPVTKAEIEAIRGVQSGPMLRTLVDRGLVRVTGRADQPGAPLQYGTTREFLDRFGLASLKDLPRDAELAGD